MNFDNYRLELLGPVDCTAATTLQILQPVIRNTDPQELIALQ